MRRLLKEVKEADPTEETLNKVEDINKRLEDYVRNSLELRNESEKGNKGES